MLSESATFVCLLTRLIAPFVFETDNEALPRGAMARLGTLNFSHGSEIAALAVSPDGKIIASGSQMGPWRPTSSHGACASSDDATVSLWEAKTGRRILTIKEASVVSLAFSPDGKTLAAVSGNGNGIRLWNTATGRPVSHKVEIDPEVGSRSVVFTRDGNLRVTAYKGTISTWNPTTGQQIDEWDPWNGNQRKAADGERDLETCSFAALSEQGNVFLFTIHRYKESKETKGALADDKTFIGIWDMSKGKTIAEFPVPWQFTGSDFPMALAPNGKSFATGSRDIFVYETATGKKLHELSLPKPAEKVGEELLRSIAIAPDNRTLVSIHAAPGMSQGPNTWRVWDLQTGKVLLKRQYHSSIPNSSLLVFSNDSKTLVFPSYEERNNGLVRLWDVRTGQEIVTAPGNRQELSSILFSPDGKAVSTVDLGRTYDWNPKSGKCLAQREHVGFTKCLARSPDGRLFVSVGTLSGGAESHVCDSVTGKKLCALEGKNYGGGFVAPNGRTVYLFTTLQGGGYQALDARTGKGLFELKTGNGGRIPVFSPDSSRLAWQVNVHGAEVFDATTGKPVRTLTDGVDAKEAANDDAIGLALSADGRTLALAYRRSTALPGRRETEQAIVVVFDVETGKEIGRISPPEEELFAGHLITSIALSPDGRLLAATHLGQATPRVWEVASGRERGRLETTGAWASTVIFAPDGKTLVSGHVDGTALVWDLNGPLSRHRPADAERKKDALWADLRSADAVRADDAIWSLVRSPAVALPLLREKLRPVRAAGKRIEQLIADLDADDFATRRRAASELEAFREAAEPALRAALEKSPSPEARRAVGSLLDGLSQLSPQGLLELRAVEVLERIGGSQAKGIVRSLAEGHPAARLTREAKTALRRMGK